MMHPSRIKYLPYLKEKLNTDKVSLDNGSGIWDNCRRAWLMYDKDADYHFVIQDDSIVTSNFSEKVQSIIDKNTRDFCYVLYAGRPRLVKHIKTAKRQKLDHLVFKRIFNEVAIGLPTNKIKSMVAYCDKYGDNTDKYIQRFIQDNRLLAYYPMPSLINHRDEGSLHNLNRGNYARVANWFEP